jgi:hypothetical protein
MEDIQWIQINPKRSIQGASFNRGLITYEFEPNCGSVWIPSESYFRIRLKITAGDGATQLVNSANIAPAMFCADNLFSKCQARINDTVVSEVHTHYSQVAALRHRLTKPSYILDNLSKQMISEPRFEERQHKITSDGQDERSPSWVHPSNVASTIAILGVRPDNTAVAGNAQQNHGVVTGVNTTFNTDLKVGDKLKVDGGIFYVQAIAGDLAATVHPSPTLDIAATANWFVSRGSERLTNMEIIYQPPIGLFSVKKGINGRCKIVFTPDEITKMKKNIIESILADKTVGAAGDFEVSVESMYLYYAQRRLGPSIKELEQSFLMTEIGATTELIETSSSIDYTQFQVPARSQKYTVAFQDDRILTNSIYSRTRFKVNGDEELKLTKIYLTRGNQKVPMIDPDPSVLAGTDYITQRYYDSQAQSGMLLKSPESLKDWKERGAYYHFSMNDDEKINQVRTTCQFSADINNLNMILFHHTRKAVLISGEKVEVVDT